VTAFVPKSDDEGRNTYVGSYLAKINKMGSLISLTEHKGTVLEMAILEIICVGDGKRKKLELGVNNQPVFNFSNGRGIWISSKSDRDGVCRKDGYDGILNTGKNGGPFVWTAPPYSQKEFLAVLDGQGKLTRVEHTSDQPLEVEGKKVVLEIISIIICYRLR
jgi:hypothetical protein